MNSFLKQIIIAIVMIFFGGSLAFTQNCNTPPCYGLSCNCQTWSAWAERMVTYIPPAYPLCTLNVFYCYRQCLDNPECTEIYIKFIQAGVFCGQCNDFFYFLEIGDDWERARKIRYLYIQIFRSIVFKTWELFLDNTHSDFWPYCDQGTRKKYFNRTAKCLAFCYTQYPIDDPETRMLITAMNCTDDACCLRWIELCVDRNTGQTISNEYRESTFPVDCYDLNLPLTVCPPGLNVTITRCIDDCDQE